MLLLNGFNGKGKPRTKKELEKMVEVLSIENYTLLNMLRKKYEDCLFKEIDEELEKSKKEFEEGKKISEMVSSKDFKMKDFLIEMANKMED